MMITAQDLVHGLQEAIHAAEIASAAKTLLVTPAIHRSGVEIHIASTGRNVGPVIRTRTIVPWNHIKTAQRNPLPEIIASLCSSHLEEQKVANEAAIARRHKVEAEMSP